MPEFEETNSQPNPSHSYTPSSDASKKPRGRRRSGGFKTEVASSSSAGMGEVSATDALQGEKLSGSARPQQDREERPDSVDSSADTAQEERAPRVEREPREERITNPQPSEDTLATIKSVEDKLSERRAERDARRKERDANRPARSERKPDARGKKPPAKGKGKQPQKKGLLAKILGVFGIGNKPKDKPTGKRGGNRGRQNRQGGNRGGNRNSNRGGQNRHGGNRGGQGRGGNRGGQGRRQGNEKPHSAKSLSNES
jgi:hypothetical protein